MTATLPVSFVWTQKITRLYRLSSRRPLVVLSRQLFVPLPLAVLSLRRPLVLSLRHPLVHSSHQLVVTSPLLILSLRRPLVLSSRRLVVASPLNAPPSRCLVVSLCHLSLSCRASWLSHHHLSSSSRYTALSFSHHAGWLLCCLSLRLPLVVASPLIVISLRRPIVVFLCCRIASRRPLVAPPSHHLVAPACCRIASPRPLVAPRANHSSSRRAGWLLRRLSTRRPLVVLSSCRAASRCLVTPAGCCINISCRPLVALHSRPLIVLAGCCVASPCANKSIRSWVCVTVITSVALMGMIVPFNTLPLNPLTTGNQRHGRRRDR
jgi:hypothetical protein